MIERAPHVSRKGARDRKENLVNSGASPFQAVDFIAFFQEQSGQVRAILSSDSGNQSFFDDFHVNGMR